MKGKLIILLALFAFLCLLLKISHLNENSIVDKKIFEISGVISTNLIVNGNFCNNLKFWGHGIRSGVISSNGINYVCINGIDVKNQVRICQNINVTSGKLHRLSFFLSSDDSGAFAIYRDSKTGKEKYYFCQGRNNNKKIEWFFTPERSGINEIYLSTNQKGTFYFSNVSCVIFNKELYSFYKKIIFISFLFVFLLILFFVVSYNVFFVCFLLLLLIIPILRIDKETKSIKENRRLSNYKNLFLLNDNKFNINYNYGIDFNNWLNDHFYNRKFIIDVNYKLSYLINRNVENKAAFSGREDWLFNKRSSNIGNLTLRDEENANKILKNINKLVDKFNKNNIRTIFAVIPEKETIYSEHLNYREYVNEPLSDKILSLTEDFFKTNCYIFFKDVFIRNKNKGLLYFKDDHHWTHLGAFVAYEYIMDEIYKYDTNIIILNENNFEKQIVNKTYHNSALSRFFTNELKNGSVYDSLNLDKYMYKFKSDYYVFNIIGKKPVPTRTDGSDFAVFSYEKGCDKNIMLIGDSNIGYILPFISTTFKNSLFLYAAGMSTKDNNWNISSYENVISSFKPDYLIIMIRARNLSEWTHLIE